MSKINLLPWREETRKIKNRIFVTVLAGSFLASVIVIFLLSMYLSYRQDVEDANIAFVSQELAALQAKVAEVQRLLDEKEMLTKRINTLQALKRDRYSLIKLLDMIPRTVPENIFLTIISRKPPVQIAPVVAATPTTKFTPTTAPVPITPTPPKEGAEAPAPIDPCDRQFHVELHGTANSNAGIANLLKRLEKIQWIKDPKIEGILINNEGNALNFKVVFIQNAIAGGTE